MMACRLDRLGEDDVVEAVVGVVGEVGIGVALDDRQPPRHAIGDAFA